MELIGFIIMSIIVVSLFSSMLFFEFKPDQVRVINANGTPVVEDTKIVKKSPAFIRGFKDMLVYGLEYDTLLEDYDDNSYPYFNASQILYRSHDGRPTTTVYYADDLTPKLDDNRWKILAKSVMDKSLTINVDAGQRDRNYLGGTEKEFADYYAGGMYFLEALEKAKQRVIEDDIKEENLNRLIDSRKNGLKETNRQIVMNMEALDELRATTFKSFESMDWDRQMSELEGK